MSMDNSTSSLLKHGNFFYNDKVLYTYTEYVFVYSNTVQYRWIKNEYFVLRPRSVWSEIPSARARLPRARRPARRSASRVPRASRRGLPSRKRASRARRPARCSASRAPRASRRGLPSRKRAPRPPSAAAARASRARPAAARGATATAPLENRVMLCSAIECINARMPLTAHPVMPSRSAFPSLPPAPSPTRAACQRERRAASRARRASRPLRLSRARATRCWSAVAGRAHRALFAIAPPVTGNAPLEMKS